MQKVLIETYGCQMNVSDSEIVASILKSQGYEITNDIESADIIFLNTCSVRDNAEKRIRNRLTEFEALKKKKPHLKVGILGCMAQRLKDELLKGKSVVDMVAGPDSYRDVPSLIEHAERGEKTESVDLSTIETYSEITPVKLDTNGVSAFISIMRGCENFCSYCVVPFTRGKERSRDYRTIVKEAQDLFVQGYRDITLLGQNVNSYSFADSEGKSVNFAMLMEMVAKVNPLLRVRFATSHPKDISEELVKTIARYDNICKYIHLPIQSGSDRMLEKMNRHYNREQYMQKIQMIRESIPSCAISTDVIAGFCSETESDHKDTLSAMSQVGYDYAYMFIYSERPNTIAAKKFKDDIPYSEKQRRLEEIIALQRELSLSSNQKDVGKVFEVLVEGESKREKDKLFGRTSQNKVVVFDREDNKIGQYIKVKILSCTSATLRGEAIK